MTENENTTSGGTNTDRHMNTSNQDREPKQQANSYEQQIDLREYATPKWRAYLDEDPEEFLLCQEQELPGPQSALSDNADDQFEARVLRDLRAKEKQEQNWKDHIWSTFQAPRGRIQSISNQEPGQSTSGLQQDSVAAAIPPSSSGSTTRASSTMSSIDAPLRSNGEKRKRQSEEIDTVIRSSSEREPPFSHSVRHSWEELGLGKKTGTPAYNANQRARNGRLGLPAPRDLAPYEVALKMNSMRCRTVYLPADSPLQSFVQVPRLEDALQPVLPVPKKPAKTKTKKKRDHASGQVEVGKYDDRSESEQKLHETLPENALSGFPDNAEGSSTLPDTECERSRASERIEIFHHGLGRLYHMMCKQDADDYSTELERSNTWSANAVKAKLRSLQNKMNELDEREKKVLKQSEKLGTFNSEARLEALRLLGMVSTEACCPTPSNDGK